jgi:hypothetical protein
MADKSQPFRDLLVWQKAHAFTRALYRETGSFPKYELYALTISDTPIPLRSKRTWRRCPGCCKATSTASNVSAGELLAPRFSLLASFR